VAPVLLTPDDTDVTSEDLTSCLSVSAQRFERKQKHNSEGGWEERTGRLNRKALRTEEGHTHAHARDDASSAERSIPRFESASKEVL